MSNKESVAFTRGDAERLRAIEVKQDGARDLLGGLSKKVEYFVSTHQDQHDTINTQIGKNTRFRVSVTKTAIWLATSGGFVGLMAAIAEAQGWLN